MNRSAPFSVRHPLRILMIWAVVVIGMMVAITVYPGIRPDPTLKSMIMTNDPDRALNHEVKEIFGNDEIIAVAVENPKGVFNVPTLGFIDEITRGCERIVGVRKVYSLTHADDIRGRGATLVTDDLMTRVPTTPEGAAKVEHDAKQNPTYVNNIYAPDEKVASINVELWLDHNSPDDQAKIAKQIFDVVHKAEAHKPPGVNTYVTGFPVASYLGGTYLNNDLKKFGFGSFVVLLLLVGLILRAWQGVVATILVVMCSVAVTYGSMALFGVKVTMGLSALSTFLIALGMEYSIYVAFAFNSQTHIETRELGAPPTDHRSVLGRALWSVRGGMFLSALTTAIGFGAMLTSAVPDVRLMGVFLAIGTMTAGLGAMTIVPALTTLRPYRVRPEQQQNRTLQRIIDAIGRFDVKRPKVALAAMAVLLAAGAVSVTHLRSDSDAVSYFKKDSDIRKASEFVRKRMGGTTYLMAVVSADKVDTFKDPANLAKLDQVKDYAETLPHVRNALSQADNIKLINRALHEDDPAEFKLPSTRAAVEQFLLLHNKPDDFRLVIDSDYRHANVMLRLDSMSAHVMTDVEKKMEVFMKKTFPSFDSNVVGTTLLVHRAFEYMAWSTVKSLATAALLIWVVMTIAFRSFKLGILVLIPNLAPALVVYAVLPLVGRKLDVPTSGTGAIALGIAIDDTTHFFKTWMAKVKEGTYTSETAVKSTLSEIGQPMVLSSLVLAAGFSLQALSSYGALVWTGIMMVTVALTALVWDVFCTPAMLRLVGVGRKKDDK